MKKILTEFLRRGMTVCGLGPLVLVVIYQILRDQGMMETLTVDQVCLGILSLSALAFVAGGMNVVYQLERLPLMVAVLIHGSVLYASYLITYLVNGWLAWGAVPILVFTVLFVLGYLVIWAIIYSVTKKNTERINAVLKGNREKGE